MLSKIQDQPSLKELLQQSVLKNNCETARLADQKINQKRFKIMVGCDPNNSKKEDGQPDATPTQLQPSVSKATDHTFFESSPSLSGLNHELSHSSAPQQKYFPFMEHTALKNLSNPNSSYKYFGLEQVLANAAREFSFNPDDDNSEEDEMSNDELQSQIKKRKHRERKKRQQLQTDVTAAQETIKSIDQIRKQIKVSSLLEKEIKLDTLKEKQAQLRKQFASPELLSHKNASSVLQKSQKKNAQLPHSFSFSQLQNDSEQKQREESAKNESKASEPQKNDQQIKETATDSSEKDLDKSKNYNASFIGHISAIFGKPAQQRRKIKSIDFNKQTQNIFKSKALREQMEQVMLLERQNTAAKLIEESMQQLPDNYDEALQIDNGSTSQTQQSSCLSDSKIPESEIAQLQCLCDQAERVLASPIKGEDKIHQSELNQVNQTMPNDYKDPESQPNLTLKAQAQTEEKLSPNKLNLQGTHETGLEINSSIISQMHTATKNSTLANLQQIPFQLKTEASSPKNAHIGSSMNFVNQATGYTQSTADNRYQNNNQTSSLSLKIVASPRYRDSQFKRHHQNNNKALIQSQSQRPDLLQICRKVVMKQLSSNTTLQKPETTIHQDQSSKKMSIGQLQQSVTDINKIKEVSNDIANREALMGIISTSNSESQIKFKPTVALQDESNTLILQNQQQTHHINTSHTTNQHQICLLTESADEFTLGTPAGPTATADQRIDSSQSKMKRLQQIVHDKEETGHVEDRPPAQNIFAGQKLPAEFFAVPTKNIFESQNKQNLYPKDIFIPCYTSVDSPLDELELYQDLYSQQTEPLSTANQPVRIENIKKSNGPDYNVSIERPIQVNQLQQQIPERQHLRQTQFNMQAPDNLHENVLDSKMCWDFRLKMQKRFGLTMTALHKSKIKNVVQTLPQPLKDQIACESIVQSCNTKAAANEQLIEQKEIESLRQAIDAIEGWETNSNLQDLLDFAPIYNKNFECKNSINTSFSPKITPEIQCHSELQKHSSAQQQEHLPSESGEINVQECQRNATEVPKRTTPLGALVADHGQEFENLLQRLKETDTKEFLLTEPQTPSQLAKYDKNSQPFRLALSGNETPKLQQLSEQSKPLSPQWQLKSSISPTDLASRGNIGGLNKHKLVDKAMRAKNPLTKKKNFNNFSSLQTSNDHLKSQQKVEVDTKRSKSNLCIDTSAVQISLGDTGPSQVSKILTPHLPHTNVKIALHKEKSKRIQQILNLKRSPVVKDKKKGSHSQNFQFCNAKLQNKSKSPHQFDQEHDKTNNEILKHNQATQSTRMPILTAGQGQFVLDFSFKEKLHEQALRTSQNFSKNQGQMNLGDLGQILLKASEKAVANQANKVAICSNRDSLECANLLLQCDEEEDRIEDSETQSSPYPRRMQGTLMPQNLPKTNEQKSRQDLQTCTEDEERQQLYTAKGWTPTPNRTQQQFRQNLEDVFGIKSTRSENEVIISEDHCLSQKRMENDIKEMQSLLPPLLESHFFKEDDINLSEEDRIRARKRIKDESVPLMYVKDSSKVKSIRKKCISPNSNPTEKETCEQGTNTNSNQARIEVQSPLDDEKFHIITVSPVSAERQKFYLGVKFQLNPTPLSPLSVLRENPQSQRGAISVLDKQQAAATSAMSVANVTIKNKTSPQWHHHNEGIINVNLSPPPQNNTQTQTPKNMNTNLQQQGPHSMSKNLSPIAKGQASLRKLIKNEKGHEKRIANNFSVTVKKNLNQSVDLRPGMLSPTRLGVSGLSVKRLAERTKIRKQQTASLLSPLFNQKDNCKRGRVSIHHITQKIPNLLIPSSEDFQSRTSYPTPTHMQFNTIQSPLQFDKNKLRETLFLEPSKQGTLLEVLPAKLQKSTNRAVSTSVDFNKQAKNFRFPIQTNSKLAPLKLPPVSPLNCTNLSYDLNILKQEYNKKLINQVSSKPQNGLLRTETLLEEQTPDLQHNVSCVFNDRESPLNKFLNEQAEYIKEQGKNSNPQINRHQSEALDIGINDTELEGIPTVSRETLLLKNTPVMRLNEDLNCTFSNELISQKTEEYRKSQQQFYPNKTQTVRSIVSVFKNDQQQQDVRSGSAHYYDSNTSGMNAQTGEEDSNRSLKKKFDFNKEIDLEKKKEIMLNEHAITMAKLRAQEAEQAFNESCLSKQPISFSGQNLYNKDICRFLFQKI